MNVTMENSTSSQTQCNSASMQGAKLLTYDAVIYAIQFVFGFPTHSYIVWLIVTGKGTGIASEFFTLNISVCEIMLSLRSLFASMLKIFPRFWSLVMFLSGFVITGRFFHCLVCLERYLAVVHPVTFLKYKPLRYKVACSILTWLMIAIYCVFSLIIRNCFMPIFIYFYIIQFFFFISINLFCCVAVLRALKQSGPGERAREREEKNHMKRRAFHLILITTGTLSLMHVPSLFVAFQHILPIARIPELDSVSLTCFVLPGLVHPFLYIRRVCKLPFCKSL